MTRVVERLGRATRVLESAVDVVTGRVESAEPPAWCATRGWTSFLLGLDDELVARCDREGAAFVIAALPGAPVDLRELARAAVGASELPDAQLDHPVAALAPEVRGASPRKRTQLAVLLEAVTPLAARARRVVDLGSGHGQLTRLASEAFLLPSIGVERDPVRVARAEDLAAGASATRFVARDAVSQGFELEPDDLAIGLHACGALGDRLVVLAASAGASAALVGCCPQKIGAPAREPLSAAAGSLSLPREALGLANLSAGEQGVERSIAATLEGRAARHALAILLRRRGIVVGPGDEMRGVNRRRALGPFADLAARAFAARGLTSPRSSELSDALDRGRAEFASARRLSLPRAALARLVEVWIALDRAAFLIERGYDASVVELVPRAVTPRNVAVLASPTPPA